MAVPSGAPRAAAVCASATARARATAAAPSARAAATASVSATVSGGVRPRARVVRRRSRGCGRLGARAGAGAPRRLRGRRGRQHEVIPVEDRDGKIPREKVRVDRQRARVGEFEVPLALRGGDGVVVALALPDGRRVSVGSGPPRGGSRRVAKGRGGVRGCFIGSTIAVGSVGGAVGGPAPREGMGERDLGGASESVHDEVVLVSAEADEVPAVVAETLDVDVVETGNRLDLRSEEEEESQAWGRGDGRAGGGGRGWVKTSGDASPARAVGIRRKRTVWLGRTLSHNARARWTCAPGRAAKSSLARSFSWILKVGTSRLIAPPRPRRRPSRRTKE